MTESVVVVKPTHMTMQKETDDMIFISLTSLLSLHGQKYVTSVGVVVSLPQLKP